MTTSTTNTATIKISSFRGFGRPFRDAQIGDVVSGRCRVPACERGTPVGDVAHDVTGRVVAIGAYWSDRDAGDSGHWVEIQTDEPVPTRIDF